MSHYLINRRAFLSSSCNAFKRVAHYRWHGGQSTIAQLSILTIEPVFLVVMWLLLLVLLIAFARGMMLTRSAISTSHSGAGTGCSAWRPAATRYPDQLRGGLPIRDNLETIEQEALHCICWDSATCEQLDAFYWGRPNSAVPNSISSTSGSCIGTRRWYFLIRRMRFLISPLYWSDA